MAFRHISSMDPSRIVTAFGRHGVLVCTRFLSAALGALAFVDTILEALGSA